MHPHETRLERFRDYDKIFPQRRSYKILVLVNYSCLYSQHIHQDPFFKHFRGDVLEVLSQNKRQQEQLSGERSRPGVRRLIKYPPSNLLI